MRDYIYDEPERLAGVIFHIAAILFLLGASGWGIWQAAHSEIGPVFVLYLLPALASIGLVPTLIYRLYSLLGAFYQVERDGMRLRWGLRIEDIPMDTILWVSLIADLERKPPMPWIRWPGAVLGTRHLPNGTPFEYLASNSRDLILVATQRDTYAISPATKSFPGEIRTLHGARLDFPGASALSLPVVPPGAHLAAEIGAGSPAIGIIIEYAFSSKTRARNNWSPPCKPASQRAPITNWRMNSLLPNARARMSTNSSSNASFVIK